MNPGTSTIGPPETGELSLPLTDPAHLFNAPRVDPLSPGPLEGLGISGFDYLLGLLHLDNKRQRTRTLTLSLPAEKAAAASAEQLTNAIHRYAGWRIEHERRELRNTHRYGLKVAGFALVMLAVCLALSSLFASDLTEWMRPLIRKTFEYGFEIIGWVILWHPIDVLVFSPVAIRARLAALQTLATVDVVIRAEPARG
ncbi:MAG: hypothetical protein NT167_01705 [Verrucomicrobia bacterium]|nr:hypothetical protein [Verrucomicrobiota bacterium]